MAPAGTVTSDAEETSAFPGSIPRDPYPLAFGLGIDSEIALPELDHGPRGSKAEVTVRVGRIPEELEGATWRGAFQQARPGAILITVPGVARFLVEDGRSIMVESPEPASSSTRLFLLGSAMGALLHQRGLLVLHAGAIEVDGKAVAFAGKSGAGKSTLAHAFQQSGHKVIADDVMAVTLLDGRPYVLPGFPRIKLWRDALKRLGTPEGDNERIRPDLEKFNIPLAEAYCVEPIPLSRMYVLRPHNKPATEVQPLKGQQRFHAFRRQTYRPKFVEALGNRDGHFLICSQVAAQVHVAAVNRPSDGFRMLDLMTALRKDWAR